jgi:hypothetical protein
VKVFSKAKVGKAVKTSLKAVPRSCNGWRRHCGYSTRKTAGTRIASVEHRTNHRVETRHQDSTAQEGPARSLDIRSLSGRRGEEICARIKRNEQGKAIATEAASVEVRAEW